MGLVNQKKSQNLVGRRGVLITAFRPLWSVWIIPHPAGFPAGKQERQKLSSRSKTKTKFKFKLKFKTGSAGRGLVRRLLWFRTEPFCGSRRFQWRCFEALSVSVGTFPCLSGRKAPERVFGGCGGVWCCGDEGRMFGWGYEVMRKRARSVDLE